MAICLEWEREFRPQVNALESILAWTQGQRVCAGSAVPVLCNLCSQSHVGLEGYLCSGCLNCRHLEARKYAKYWYHSLGGKERAEPKSVLPLLSGLKFQIELFEMYSLDSGSHWKAPLLHLPAPFFLLISPSFCLLLLIHPPSFHQSCFPSKL